VAVGTIRASEPGASNPSLGTARAVVEALGLPLDRVVEAMREGRARSAVVTRAAAGDADLPAGLADAAPAARIVTLPVKSLAPRPAEAAGRPSLAFAVAGRLLATTEAGERVRPGPGDTCHA
jgi:hypothetical protein